MWFFKQRGRQCALPFLLVLAVADTSVAWGADSRVGFLVRGIDQQYFTTPYERAAILGGAYMGEVGSAASTIRNPAALSSICGPDVLGYWLADSTKGEASLTPRSDTAQRTTAFLSDEGVYVALPLGCLPINAGFGGDYFSTGFSDDPAVLPGQRGSRISAALATSVFGNISLGYGLTWFNDYYATGAEFDIGMQTPTERLTNESNSWRHRFALSGPLRSNVRWGLQADYGHGSGTPRLDNLTLTGKRFFETYAARGGFQWDMSQRITWAADFEWSYLELNMGELDLVGGGIPMQYAADVYRPMVGVQFRATPNLLLRSGYRHSFYRFRESSLFPDESDYSTVSGGVRYAFWEGRAAVDWNIEHSWVADGSLLNTLTFSCMF